MEIQSRIETLFSPNSRDGFVLVNPQRSNIAKSSSTNTSTWAATLPALKSLLNINNLCNKLYYDIDAISKLK